MEQEAIYLIVTWISTFLNFLMVVNRLYVRAVRRSNTLNWSDVLVVFAWVFVGILILPPQYAFCHGGYFGHVDDLNKSTLDSFDRLKLMEDIVFYIPVFCTKGAILAFLLEITPPIFTGIRKAIWAGVVMVGAGAIYTVITSGFYHQHCYMLNRKDGRLVYLAHGLPACTNFGFFGIATRVTVLWHILTDIYIFAIPFFLIRHLPTLLTGPQKWRTYAMFGAGFITIGLALPNMNVWPVPESMFLGNYFFGMAEQFLAITITCLPTLRITTERFFNYSRSHHGQPDAYDQETAQRQQRRTSIMNLRRGELDTREVVDKVDGLDAKNSGSDVSVQPMIVAKHVGGPGSGCYLPEKPQFADAKC